MTAAPAHLRPRLPRDLELSRVMPNETQELLLHAALCQDARAQAYLHAWSAAVDLDAIDLGSFRMLPLLYVNSGSMLGTFDQV